MKKLATILLLATGLACSTSNEMKSKLIGVWTLEEKVNIFGDPEFKIPITNSGITEESKSKPEISIHFFEDNSLIAIQNGEKSKVRFKIVDSTLTIGNREFKILELEEDELRLKDASPFAAEEQIFRKK